MPKKQTKPRATKSPTTFSLDDDTLDKLDVAKVKLRQKTKGRLQRGQVNKTAIVEAALAMALEDLDDLAVRIEKRLKAGR